MQIFFESRIPPGLFFSHVAWTGFRQTETVPGDSLIRGVVRQEVGDNVRRRASVPGVELASVGMRDVILSGDMKDLMNKVTEAKKTAEANLIFCREETLPCGLRPIRLDCRRTPRLLRVAGVNSLMMLLSCHVPSSGSEGFGFVGRE